VEPQLASWDAAGHPAQIRLAVFLDHVESIIAPTLSTNPGQLVVELTVGLPRSTSLVTGGRDLDNYLYPIAQRLGSHRLAAVFGRKTHGPSRLKFSPAQPSSDRTPMFVARMTGSYERRAWKAALRDRLLDVGVEPVAPGPVALDVAITIGPSRNWANLWKPLFDAMGPVLGEDPHRPFHPHDDRIVSLGLHHHIDPGIGHDVIIAAWWWAADAKR
jgi:hypothetical protein